ncbi:MAG: hypothetical protein WKF92_12000 [Pyrinomonadaceae bacterium]
MNESFYRWRKSHTTKLKTIVALILIWLAASCSESMLNSSNTTPRLTIGPALNDYPTIPADWKKVETDNFYFYIPPSMKKIAVQGIDSSVWQYEDENITLEIEQGFHTADLTDLEERYESIEDIRVVNGETARLVLADINAPKTGKWAVNSDGSTKFTPAKKNLFLGAYYQIHGAVFEAVSGTESSLNTSRIILQSIKFKK